MTLKEIKKVIIHTKSKKIKVYKEKTTQADVAKQRNEAYERAMRIV